MNHRNSVLHSGLVALLGVLVGMVSPALSQVTAGGIRGVVSDPTGAVIPGADITAMNTATGQAASAQTTEAGVFVLGNIPVGDYDLAVESEGFKRYFQTGVNVATATTSTINVTLDLGDVTETVTVEGAALPLMQTDNSEISTVMERKMVLDLPLDLGGRAVSGGSGRRQIDAFVFLTPGIVGNQWKKSFMGSAGHTSQAIIDGIPHALQESPGLTARTSPPFEAVEEFKVSTTMYPADQGRGFGITNFTLKSGTNNFHGNAFMFLRNGKLDATGFFNTIQSSLRQNEFGGTLGGPIIKNKTFFYGSYQGFRKRGIQGARGLNTIPPVAFRSGDFSALRTPSGELIRIFDPSTTTADGAGGFVRQPFPDNRIPQHVFAGGIAENLLSLLPEPDSPGIERNWVSRAFSPNDDDVWSIKVDHNAGSHRISFSYWWVDYNAKGFSSWGSNIPDTGTKRDFTGGGYRVNWDWVVRPTVLNHFGWGFSTSDKERLGNSEAPGNILGIPNIPQDVSEYPRFELPGYLAMGNSRAGPDLTTDDAVIFTDTLSWTRGRHQLKIGGEYWWQRFSRFDGREAAGVFRFNRLSTSQPNDPLSGSLGDPVASLLTGDVWSSIRRVNPTKVLYDTQYLAMFVDDKIQITPKLTASLGLRYDLPWAIGAKDDIISALDPNLPNEAAGGLPGAYVFGNDRVRPGLDLTEWGPRAALAYTLNEKTVIRSGFGIIYAQANALVSGMELRGHSLIAGWVDISNTQTLDQGVTSAFMLENGPPAFRGTLPNLDSTIKIGDQADYMNPHGGKAAYTTNYNFTIQRQLPGNMYVDLAYVGNKGTNLPSNMETLNQVSSQYLSLGPTLQQQVGSPQANAVGIGVPYPRFRGSVNQALRPYPQYLDIVLHASPIGNHTYHSFQMKAQRRFSNRLGFLVSYTMSKNISDTNGNSWSAIEHKPLDTGNRGLEKSLSPIDVTHNLVTNWIYQLPGNSLTGAAGKMLKGWQLAVTTLYQSGAPIAISGGSPLPIFGGGNRPSRVAGVSGRTGVGAGEFDPATDLYLDVNAYQVSAPFTLGDVSRREPNIRTFPFLNESVTLSKRTFIPSISENFNVEFRAEFFNIFNRVVFGGPATNVNNRQSFGKIGGQANVPRTIQFALKVNF